MSLCAPRGREGGGGGEPARGEHDVRTWYERRWHALRLQSSEVFSIVFFEQQHPHKVDYKGVTQFTIGRGESNLLAKARREKLLDPL